jgi:hypothetical protein
VVRTEKELVKAAAEWPATRRVLQYRAFATQNAISDAQEMVRHSRSGKRTGRPEARERTRRGYARDRGAAGHAQHP